MRQHLVTPEVIVARKLGRAKLVRSVGLRALRGVRRMKREKADGIRVVLVDEWNARAEQDQFEVVAEVVLRTIKQRGLYGDVRAFETEHAGGQCNDFRNHVVLTVLKRQPMDASDFRNMRILEC